MGGKSVFLSLPLQLATDGVSVTQINIQLTATAYVPMSANTDIRVQQSAAIRPLKIDSILLLLRAIDY